MFPEFKLNLAKNGERDGSQSHLSNIIRNVMNKLSMETFSRSELVVGKKCAGIMTLCTLSESDAVRLILSFEH